MKNHYYNLSLLLGCALLSTNVVAQSFPVYEINQNFISCKSSENPGLWETGIFRGNFVWGDFNNNGNMDLFAVGNTTAESWHANMFGWENTNNGNFKLYENLPFLYRSDPSIINTRGTNGAVFAVLDYNNDGNLDMIQMGIKEGFDEKSTVPEELFINLYKGNGDGTFTLVENTGLRAVTIEQESAYQSAIAIADIDRDGYNDIAITGRLNKDRILDLYKNNGDGTFTLMTETNVDGGTLSGINSGTIAFGDYDKDGYPDLLINGWTSAPSTFICHNEKNFKFKLMDMSIDDGTEGLPALTGSQKGGVAWADINNDGWLDCVISGETYKNSQWGRTTDLLINRTNNCTLASFEFYPELQFERVATAVSGISAQQKNGIDIADINNDGFLDIIMAGESGGAELRLCMGKGNNQFDEDNSYINGGFRSGAACKIADYDNDGFLDFAAMGYGKDGPALSVYHHKGAYYNDLLEEISMEKNTAPTAPTDVKISEKDGKLFINWQPGSDKESTQKTLRYNVCVEKNNGERFMIVPADIANGKLKTSDCDQAILETQLAMNIAYSDVKKCYVQTIDQGKMTSAFTESTPTSLSDVVAPKLTISRNGNILTINTTEDASLSVYDICGSLIATIESNNGQFILPQLKGAYIVTVSTAKAHFSNKIIF